ncbi:MAG: hypothetical protein GVY08_14845 [Bacteroidetes bacterium]|jgi:hypothetical protein|nr:hypothetical protein [Bacteroidota bacterium]
MFITIQKTILAACVLLAGVLVISSCDTTSTEDSEEHSDPFGVALILNGVEVAIQENGEITYSDGSHMELEVGEETNLINLRWIDEDGDRFTPDTNEGFSLKWTIADENVLEVEQHEEDGPWSFHLVGVGSGESEVAFELWHNDHADFTSLPFEVHVEEVVSGLEIRDESGQSVISVNNSGEVTGTFNIAAGETTTPYSAVFLDEDGADLDTDHDYELEFHLEGADVATINPVDGSPFSFTITGNASGQASAHFALMKGHEDHGGSDDDGHDHEGEIEVYESPDITINVN